MAYGIFDSTNIKGRNFSFVHTADIENGSLIAKGALVSGSKDVYNVALPTVDDEVFVVGNPAWDYDTSSTVNQNAENYIIKAGTIFRAYELLKKDKFTIADYGITGTPAEGEFVATAAGAFKPVASTTKPTDDGFIGQVVRIKEYGFLYEVGETIDQRLTKVTIEVLQNG
jgi:hypothetical protein